MLAILLLACCPGQRAAAGELIANRVDLGGFYNKQEMLLVNALQKISSNQIDGAIDELRQLVNVNPDFRLAQLVYADLLLSKASPITDFGSISFATRGQLSALREEAQMRWRRYHVPPPPDRIPASLVKLSPDQRHVILVNMAESRLYLYENRDGIPVLVRDFYASIGKNGSGKFVQGDQKTPVGVYFVTGVISPDKLPDLYGDGAFPIDYPNPWDQRNGRTGYGIWLHGTPSNTYSRPPRDSDGCVILSNEDLNLVSQFITPGLTPMILAEDVEWLTLTQWQARQADMRMLVEQWRKDWESRDSGLYLGHYSPQYAGLGMDYKSWVNYKRRVNSSKRYIRVGVTDESMFMYPGEQAMLVVTFEQEYASDSNRRRFIKRQYWRHERDGRWRIIYEGSVS